MAEKIKSKYAGVYYIIVPGPGGRGSDRKFYIKYRRGDRGSKEINELVGTESQDWTEKRALDERLRRKAGDAMSNAEKRQELFEERQARKTLATYSEIWDGYLANGRGRRPDLSIRNDISLHNQHLDVCLGDRPVSEIRICDISELRKEAEKKGLSPQSVKHIVSLVRRVLRWGVKHGLCRMPENLLFDMPSVDNKKTETMTGSQLGAYLKALDDEPDQVGAAILRLALATGMRKSAILALRWEDIDIERGLIALRGENGKNGKTAILPLNDVAMEIIL
ncbi:MAG: tyrosine-type recombinase/integrase [Desulfovibrio sp.]|nr:tyrosine-type recombinase/integrase [Desulfovibrio sp.]